MFTRNINYICSFGFFIIFILIKIRENVDMKILAELGSCICLAKIPRRRSHIVRDDGATVTVDHLERQALAI